MTRICLTIALAASLASEVTGQVKEGEYRGKTISEWLSTPRQGTLSDEAKQAILEAGTNSLPFLIHATQGRLWRADEPTTELQLSNWMLQVNRRWNAIEAFTVLGHQAAPAIPELLRLSKEAATEHQRESAIFTLSFLKEDGLAALVTIAGDQTHPEKSHAFSVIESVHWERETNGRFAVPVLLKCLRNQDPKIVQYAAKSLGVLALEPETVVPALTNIIQSADDKTRVSVINAFSNMAAAGALFAPTLVAALNDPALEVRQLATSLLSSNPAAIHVVGTMGERGRPAVPALIEGLRNKNAAAEAAEALGNLGFDAPTVISALSRNLKTYPPPDVRLASVKALGKFGAKANWAASDLLVVLNDSSFEIRVAVTNTLLKIMPETLQTKEPSTGRDKNTNPAIFRF
jgi:HEAT repeat protein